MRAYNSRSVTRGGSRKAKGDDFGRLMKALSKPCSLLIFAIVGLTAFSGMVSSATGQKANENPPLVTGASLALYPLVAIHARIQGTVKIKVTTDGEKVSSLESESGPPMLANAAKENIRTWRFAKHKPTTFVTTFEYRIDEPSQCEFTNGTAVVHMPLEVRINANGIMTCDPSAGVKTKAR